jgi:hypothetical protein
MGIAIPLVHAAQHRIGLMHDPGRRLGDNVEVRVGNHHRQLDDAIAVRIEAGHFHVQPDERVLILCHNFQ